MVSMNPLCRSTQLTWFPDDIPRSEVVLDGPHCSNPIGVLISIPLFNTLATLFPFLILVPSTVVLPDPFSVLLPMLGRIVSRTVLALPEQPIRHSRMSVEA